MKKDGSLTFKFQRLVVFRIRMRPTMFRERLRITVRILLSNQKNWQNMPENNL